MNSKSKFKKDHRYVREVLRQVEHLMKQGTNDWGNIADCYCELSGVLGTLEEWATENKIEKENN